LFVVVGKAGAKPGLFLFIKGLSSRKESYSPLPFAVILHRERLRAGPIAAAIGGTESRGIPPSTLAELRRNSEN
jgi:hypothetical protein